MDRRSLFRMFPGLAVIARVKPGLLAKAPKTRPASKVTEKAHDHALYFSVRAAALTFWPRKPVRLANGDVEDGPMIKFHQLSDGYGYFTTDDPEFIAALEKRIEVCGDVIHPSEYIRRIKKARNVKPGVL